MSNEFEPTLGGAAASPSGDVLRALLEESQALILLLDHEGRIVWCGGAAHRFFGAAAPVVGGKTLAELAHPEDRTRTRREIRARIDAPDDTHARLFENRVLAANGSVHPYAWSISPRRGELGEFVGLALVGHDISAQKQLENALVESEARHRALLEGVHDPLITIDQKGIVRSVSNSVETVFGYRPDELVGRNIKLMLPEPHRSRHDGYLEQYRATQETWILGTTREFEVVHKSGHIVPIELSVSRVDIPGQAEPLFTGSFRDISRRKATEAALREREQRLRAIFDQEFQLVGLLDAQGILLEANRASLELIGCAREEVVGRFYPDTPWWRNAEPSRARLIEALPRVLAGEFERFEVEHTDCWGAVHTVDFSLKPVFDDEGRVTHMIPEGRDITELKRALESEHRFLRAMAEVGETAAVLAHEIKNPVTAVNYALEAVSDVLGEDSREVIEDLSSRMQHLERKLRRTLSFVRPLELERQGCCSHALLEHVITVLAAEMERAGVELSIETESRDIAFRADRARVEDVLINLIRNASQAVGAGGRVRVGSSLLTPSGVEFYVDDDGPGVPADERPHLFKPFVTTRSEGTGLGLAICRRVVEAHEGRIEVSDGPLGGARFTVRLPRLFRSDSEEGVSNK